MMTNANNMFIKGDNLFIKGDMPSIIYPVLLKRRQYLTKWNTADIVAQPFLQDKVVGGMKQKRAPVQTNVFKMVVEKRVLWILHMYPTVLIIMVG